MRGGDARFPGVPLGSPTLARDSPQAIKIRGVAAKGKMQDEETSRPTRQARWSRESCRVQNEQECLSLA